MCCLCFCPLPGGNINDRIIYLLFLFHLYLSFTKVETKVLSATLPHGLSYQSHHCPMATCGIAYLASLFFSLHLAALFLGKFEDSILQKFWDKMQNHQIDSKSTIRCEQDSAQYEMLRSGTYYTISTQRSRLGARAAHTHNSQDLQSSKHGDIVI